MHAQLFDQHGQLRTDGELVGERSMLLLVHPGPVDEKDPAMRRYARILQALGAGRPLNHAHAAACSSHLIQQPVVRAFALFAPALLIRLFMQWLPLLQHAQQARSQLCVGEGTEQQGQNALCAATADRMVKDAGKTLRPVLVAPDVTADEGGLTRLKQVQLHETLCWITRACRECWDYRTLTGLDKQCETSQRQDRCCKKPGCHASLQHTLRQEGPRAPCRHAKSHRACWRLSMTPMQVIERFERDVRRPAHRMACLLGLAGDDAAKASCYTPRQTRGPWHYTTLRIRHGLRSNSKHADMSTGRVQVAH